MKNQLSGLILSILGCMAFLLSCKEEISPNEKYVGIYDSFTGGIPGPDEDGNFPTGIGRVVVRKVNTQEVSVTVYENTGKTWEFPRYEIVSIDTTGNIYQYYARIVEKTNNTEIAKIRTWYLSNTPPRLERIRIDINITVEDNRNIVYYAIKRKD